MSFILDANYVITLDEIGILDSLLNLKEIIIPKMIFEKEAGNVKNFQQLVKKNGKKFSIMDASHEQKSYLLSEMAKTLESRESVFLIEVEDQCNKVALPKGWNKAVDVFLIGNNSPKPLKNVLTNGSIKEFEHIRKTEEKRVLEHPDAHFCALGLCHKKCYILSMDAGIWVAFSLLDPTKFKRRVIPIFVFLAIIFKDDPLKFIDMLTKILSARHRFAKDMFGKLASRFSIVSLEKSVDRVLYRYLAETIEGEIWKSDKDSLPNLWKLKDEAREIVRLHTTEVDDIFSFNEAQFIKDLNELKSKLQKLISVNSHNN